MTKRIMLLDVDGVLNATEGIWAIENFEPGYRGWPDWKQERFNGFLITWSPTMLGRLTSMAAEGLVEIQWLTTWAHDANRFLAEAFLMDQCHVVGAPPIWPDRTDEWWKFPLARKVFDDGHRVVWVDDDLGGDQYAWEWAAERMERFPDRLLAIAPNSLYGLSPEEVDRIEQFLRKGQQ